MVFLSKFLFIKLRVVQYAVPEYIHIRPTEGIGQWGWELCRTRIFKETDMYEN